MAATAHDTSPKAAADESSPLLEGQESFPVPPSEEKLRPSKEAPPPITPVVAANGWTAEGLPMPLGYTERSSWDSGIFACLGRNDEFCSSDLEVCLLGSVAPCVLYGSNVERLRSSPGTFANHCLTYSGLYLIGNSIFGGNCLAPYFSYTSRTAIRRQFNLEGTFEAFNRSCGCCGCDSVLQNDIHREQCETACDVLTHVFCHPCALCQEGREVRRRLPHPGFRAQPVLVMIPPGEQTMGRSA
ncbi:hypothetical protein MLD38_020381 [Melastoma candidum]|uniref:Uncharacterized protein n=1 Tax=Melastoma candidum TaxID=119954 RepID=A0ACB9QGJ1_9MYRT|nr:hypothetical protein MLD38_020381 [Melastoma candidum]